LSHDRVRVWLDRPARSRQRPSFPTRRSSDLTLGFTQIGAMKNFTGGGKDAVVATALSDVLGGTWRVEAVVGNGPPPSRGIGPSGDRKSTRLNSSHVKISYAVFCLKTKKHQRG